MRDRLIRLITILGDGYYTLVGPFEIHNICIESIALEGDDVILTLKTIIENEIIEYELSIEDMTDSAILDVIEMLEDMI